MKMRIWLVIYSLLAVAAAAQTTHYTVTDLGSIGAAPGQPFTVNTAGLVAGAAVRTDGTSHAMLWYKGTRMDLGTLGLRISNSLAFTVNDNGQVVGMADTFTTYPYREDFCGFKSFGLPTWGTECLPFVWQNGVMTPLPTLGGYNGMASWINNKGQIVGVAENAVHDTTCPAPQVLQQRPVLWDGGKAQELPLFAADPDGSAFAINDSGQIVGASGTCTSFNPNSLSGLQPLHALLWQNGKATDMGNLGGTGHGAGVLALTLNAHGQAVGFSDLPGDKANHAFTWTQATGMQDLGALPGDVSSVALNINDAAIITGISFDATGNTASVCVAERSDDRAQFADAGRFAAVHSAAVRYQFQRPDHGLGRPTERRIGTRLPGHTVRNRRDGTARDCTGHAVRRGSRSGAAAAPASRDQRRPLE